MELSEEKTKHILDFLAKKFGYDEFALNDKQIGLIKKNDSQFVTFYAIKEPNYYWITPNGLLYNANGSWLGFKPIEAKSYVKCLKMMLMLVEKGYLITTYNAFYNNFIYNNFIAPFTTLEELLIEYDLDTRHATL